MDYDYLKDTASMDGAGIDVWVGCGEKTVDVVTCIVDLMKRDSEIKILVGCTGKKQIFCETHNDSQYMRGVMLRRSSMVSTSQRQPKLSVQRSKKQSIQHK